MRETYVELVVREGQYREVETVREGDPLAMALVDQKETGVTYELRDWKRAIAEMNRKNRERREAASQ